LSAGAQQDPDRERAGCVEGIFLIREKDGLPAPIPRATAHAGRGLEGDRYCAATGTFSAKAGPGRDLTLIEAEALESLARDDGIPLPPGGSRRNVVTRGIALGELIGRRFRIGDAVECVGVKPCDPCGHLERLTRPGVKRGLENRGGLRADIVVGGRISVGDRIEPLDARADPRPHAAGS
jgi:MOSC domain-containing protein YiiM